MHVSTGGKRYRMYGQCCTILVITNVETVDAISECAVLHQDIGEDSGTEPIDI